MLYFNSISICAWIDLYYWRIRHYLHVFWKWTPIFLSWFSVSHAIFSLVSCLLYLFLIPFHPTSPPLSFMCVSWFQPHLTRRRRFEARGPMKVCMTLIQTCADSKAICFLLAINLEVKLLQEWRSSSKLTSQCTSSCKWKQSICHSAG